MYFIKDYKLSTICHIQNSILSFAGYTWHLMIFYPYNFQALSLFIHWSCSKVRKICWCDTVHTFCLGFIWLKVRTSFELFIHAFHVTRSQKFVVNSQKFPVWEIEVPVLKYKGRRAPSQNLLCWNLTNFSASSVGVLGLKCFNIRGREKKEADSWDAWVN